MKLEAEALLFDLDGTLVDSLPDLAFALDAAMVALGREAPGEAATRSWIGNGAARLIHRALTRQQNKDAPSDLFEQAYAHFESVYSANLARRTRPYPLVLETLATLKERGYRLACVTNKSHLFTRPLLDSLGMTAGFETLVCGDQVTHKKPQAEPLLLAAKQLNISISRCAMIGDSMNDIGAAQAAGCASIAVRYGYHADLETLVTQADVSVASFHELMNALA